jgi:hypothetical protein
MLMSESNDSPNRLNFWDDKRRAAFLELMRQGHPVAEAARILQCHRSTIYKEANRDPVFAEALLRSKHAVAARTPRQTIRAAAAENWRAAAWWLERVEPEKYARPAPAGPRQIAAFLEKLHEAVESAVESDRERRRLYRRLVAAMPEPFRRAWDRLGRQMESQSLSDEEETDGDDDWQDDECQNDDDFADEESDDEHSDDEDGSDDEVDDGDEDSDDEDGGEDSDDEDSDDGDEDDEDSDDEDSDDGDEDDAFVANKPTHDSMCQVGPAPAGSVSSTPSVDGRRPNGRLSSNAIDCRTTSCDDERHGDRRRHFDTKKNEWVFDPTGTRPSSPGAAPGGRSP